jgi:hypothetical protein
MTPFVPPPDDEAPDPSEWNPREDADEPDPGADEPVTVATYRFAHEAEFARLVLEREGIRAFILDAETVAMDWLLGGAVGYIKLQVAASQAEAAAALLAERPKPSDQEAAENEGAESTCLACGAPLAESQSRCPACGWSYEDEG